MWCDVCEIIRWALPAFQWMQVAKHSPFGVLLVPGKCDPPEESVWRLTRVDSGVLHDKRFIELNEAGAAPNNQSIRADRRLGMEGASRVPTGCGRAISKSTFVVSATDRLDLLSTSRQFVWTMCRLISERLGKSRIFEAAHDLHHAPE